MSQFDIDTRELEAALWLERNGYPRLEQMFAEFVDGPISRSRMNTLLAPLLADYAEVANGGSATPSPARSGLPQDKPGIRERLRLWWESEYD